MSLADLQQEFEEKHNLSEKSYAQIELLSHQIQLLISIDKQHNFLYDGNMSENQFYRKKTVASILARAEIELLDELISQAKEAKSMLSKLTMNNINPDKQDNKEPLNDALKLDDDQQIDEEDLPF